MKRTAVMFFILSLLLFPAQIFSSVPYLQTRSIYVLAERPSKTIGKIIHEALHIVYKHRYYHHVKLLTFVFNYYKNNILMGLKLIWISSSKEMSHCFTLFLL
jgi:hypothetical protein